MSQVQNFEKPLFISCTPLNENENRYMKFNSHGFIRHFRNEDSNQINVQYFDSTVHPTVEFPNERDYSYADLSANALLFASARSLSCIHFDRDHEENEWSLQMPKGEQIKAVCLGERFVAVATSHRHVRFYSLNGTQHQLISVPGPIQCLVASNRTLVAVYHSMLPLPGEQSMDAMIVEVDLENRSVVNLEFSPVRLPLTSGSSLRWIGFTDEGTLGMYDSAGSLKLFKSGLGLNWLEVANLLQQVDQVESVFIISVSDLLQQVRCVPCHKSRYPSPEQVPVMQNLKFNLALCKTANEVNDLEERNILSSIRCSMLNSLTDHVDTASQVKEALKQQVDSLFKIFQAANQSNNEMRQLDAARLIPSLKTIESLIKYSEQARLVGLVPKLNELLENKRNDANEQINLFTALPNRQSTLQRNEGDCEHDEITPLIIDRSLFEKPAVMTETVLDELVPNRFGDDVCMDAEEDDVIQVNEDDELLQVVTSCEVNTSIKNPFKV